MEEFCDGAANLVAKNEELAKARRVTRHDHNLYVSGEVFAEEIGKPLWSVQKHPDEGRSFFACTGRKKHMERLTSPFYDKETGLCGIPLLLASRATELQYGAFVILSSDTVAQVR